jgi:N-acetylglucosamine malate deacetylase 2
MWHAACALDLFSPSALTGLPFDMKKAPDPIFVATLARSLAATLAEIAPVLVLCHPYEGGHPDHDATAFAVAATCRLLKTAGANVPFMGEFTSYHQGPTGIEAGCFLERTPGELELPLRTDVQAAKRLMMDD